MARSDKKGTAGGARPSGARAPLLLLVTVVLSLPVVREVLAGQVPGSSAALRTGAAVLVAWAAVAGVGNLVDGYRRHNSSRPPHQPPSAGDSPPS